MSERVISDQNITIWAKTLSSDQNVEIIAKCCKAINMLKFYQIVQCDQDAEMSE